jgi:LysM repeat protein
VGDLARLNNGLDVRKPLKSGQVLVVEAGPVEARPAKVSPAIGRAKTAALAAADADASERPQTGTATATPPRTIRYTVKAGDNLWTIAQAHGVSLDDLKRWNGLAGRRPALKPGQALEIRTPEAS